MPFALIPWVMNNWQLIAKIIGAIAIAVVCWWFFIHNPKKIKALEAEVAEKSRQVESAYAAVNLLQEIAAEHKKIEDLSNENINKIRTGRKPGVRGVFVSNGMLAAVYQPYSSGN